MIAGPALADLLGVFGGLATNGDVGGSRAWPSDHPVFPDVHAALVELRSWRTLRPLLVKLVGQYRGGETGTDPDVDLEDLVELGVLVKVPFDPAVHKDSAEFEMEAGEDHYVLTPLVEGLLGHPK